MSLRINGGSGQRRFGTPEFPWVNVDRQERWSPEVLADIASMPMFDDNSADIIVYHHSAEHLTLDDSKSAFHEAWRVLKPGESLLVFVPDLTALVQYWIEGRISDFIFAVNLHGAWQGDPCDLHRWSWTQKTLKEHLLKSAPWSRVIPFDWRPIPGADIAGRDFWIQAQEAIK